MPLGRRPKSAVRTGRSYRQSFRRRSSGGTTTRLIAELVDDSRLVTLTGPGGVGKTRLAFEVARAGRTAPRTRRLRRRTGSASTNPAAVPDLIVASLGLIADGRTAVDMLTAVGALDVLIVLDNAEHVIERPWPPSSASWPVVRQLAILATSRERLALDGEQVWTVAPLASAGPMHPLRRCSANAPVPSGQCRTTRW